MIRFRPQPGSTPKATTLKLAFDFLKRDALTTEYARGNVPCFFGIFSDETSIKFGYVLINSDDDPSIIEACFYEELMQTLGLPRDAQGSEHFTFDNRAGERRTEQYSILVKTLYGEGVLYGDSVETLIRAMERSSLFR